jgi:hypothetical protein
VWYEISFYSRESSEVLLGSNLLISSKSSTKGKNQFTDDQRLTGSSSDSDTSTIKMSSRPTIKKRRVLSSSSDDDDNDNELVLLTLFSLSAHREKIKGESADLIPPAPQHFLSTSAPF